MITRFKQSEAHGIGASALEAVLFLKGISPQRRELSPSYSLATAKAGYFRRGNFCPASSEGAEYFVQLFAMPRRYPDLASFEAMEAIEVIFEYALARGRLLIRYR